MSDWLLDMITNVELDSEEQSRVDSLDNVYNVNQAAILAGINSNIISDSTFVDSVNSVSNQIISDQQFKDLNPDITTSRPGGWLGSRIIESMSVTGSEIAEGAEDKGFRIDPSAIAHRLPPTEGLEYYERVLQQYGKEIDKQSDLLLKPSQYEGKLKRGVESKLMELNDNLIIRDNLTKQLSEVYETIPKTEEYEDIRNIYLSKIESNPTGSIVYASKNKDDFVQYIPSGDSPLQPIEEPEALLSSMTNPLRDDTQFLPIPEEIASLKGWGRNPFTEVDEALTAIQDFQRDSTNVDLPIAIEDQPEWAYDPKYDN